MNKSNERVNEIDEMLLIADSDSKIIPPHTCEVKIGKILAHYDSFATVGFTDVGATLPDVRILAACNPAELVLGVKVLLDDTIKMIKALPDEEDRTALKVVLREMVSGCLKEL